MHAYSIDSLDESSVDLEEFDKERAELAA